MITIKKNNYYSEIIFTKSKNNDYNENENTENENIENENIENNTPRDYLNESLMRSKRLILDYALNNNFNYFVTFTFDSSKINRSNFNSCKNKILKALNNFKNRYDSEFKYILVPELHSNGIAIHFHGLIFTSNMDFLKRLYFSKDYFTNVYRHDFFFNRFGANCFIPIINSSERVAFYITKYISKSNVRVFSNSYFVSKGLNRSTTLISSNLKEFKDFIIDNVLQNSRPSFYNDFVVKYKISFDDLNKFYKNECKLLDN